MYTNRIEKDTVFSDFGTGTEENQTKLLLDILENAKHVLETTRNTTFVPEFNFKTSCCSRQL